MISSVPDADGSGGRGRVSHRLVASAGATLSLALASVVWSEMWFWGHFRPDDSALGLGQTVFAYAAVVQLCRLVARRTAVDGSGAFAWRRIFLVGLVFGWLVEGVVATTMAIDLPLSISWTGMAWHAMFTVLLGWWLVPVLLRSSRRRSILLLAAIGAAVGTWAAFWRFEDGSDPPIPEFALYMSVTTLLYALGLTGWWILRRRAEPSWLGSLAAALLLAGLIVKNAAVAPLTLLGPALVSLVIMALVIPRSPLPVQSHSRECPDSARNLWKLCTIPTASTVFYTFFQALPVALPTGWVFLAIAVPASVVLAIGALRPAAAGRWMGRRPSGLP